MGYKKPNTYTVPLMSESANAPLDSTTYWLNQWHSAMVTAHTEACVRIPKSGYVRLVTIGFTGNNGSNEAIGVELYNQTTLASETLPNTAWNSFGYCYRASCNFSVAAGDAIYVRFICPVFGVNPTNMYVNGYLLIECD